MKLTQNSTPKLYDTLTDDAGAVDLTGFTVTLEAQSVAEPTTTWSKAATIVTPPAGKIECQLTTTETANAGEYRAQWKAVNGGTVRYFPAEDYLTLEIVPAVPVVVPDNVSLLSEFHPYVRAIMGDLNPRHLLYQADAIDTNLRLVLRLGRVPGYGLTPNQRGVTPTITDPRAFGLIIYHAAKIFLMPEVAAKSFRTRPLSEARGEQKHFLFDLENVLFDLTNGEGGVFVTYQSLTGWINSLTGTSVWQHMTELKTNAPVATATIGVGGLTLSTS